MHTRRIRAVINNSPIEQDHATGVGKEFFFPVLTVKIGTWE